MPMSYPPPIYPGQEGEASAWLRPAATAPDLQSRSTEIHYLATGATTEAHPDASGQTPVAD